MKCLFRQVLAIAIAILSMGSLAESKAPQKLTLMVYMCGGNLESTYSLATSDIQEMMSAKGAGDNVSVLLMTGGAQHWSVRLHPDECHIQELKPRGIPTVWRSAGPPKWSAL